MRDYYVYMLASECGTLYIGVTNNLIRRLHEHAEGYSAFTRKYRIRPLVYYESTTSIESAIAREKQIKGWRRDRKIALAKSLNPEWRDLVHTFWANKRPVTPDTVILSRFFFSRDEMADFHRFWHLAARRRT